MKTFGYFLVIGCGLLLPLAADEVPKPASSQRALALRKAIEGADRVVVKRIGMFIVPDAEPEPTTTLSGAAKIAELAKAIDFDEQQSGLTCACSGDFLVTFYQADQALAELSYHHGIALRWHRGSWEGDSQFTPAFAAAWRAWFSANGFATFEKDHQDELAAAERERKWQDDFFGFFPPAAREAYPAFHQCFNEALNEQLEDGRYESAREDPRVIKTARGFLDACGPPMEGGLAICRALGFLNNTRGSTEIFFSMEEELLVAAVDRIPGNVMPSVLEAAATELKAVRGAGRLFFYYKYFRKVPDSTLDYLMPKLLRATIERDPSPYSLPAIIETSHLASLAVTEVLREVASGELRPLVPAPTDEREPGLRCMASLALARRGDPEAGKLVASLSPTAGVADQAALAIARSFLGERNAIRSEHFKSLSFLLGPIALAALERQGDSDALDLIITAGLDCGGAVRIVQRMTGKPWNHTESNENERDIRKWWQSAKANWRPLGAATARPK
jgi:hypothetical protein